MVYARVKAGMCDCVAGVADDEDLARVSDAGLLTASMAAEGPGEATVVAGLRTRLRHYRMEGGGALAGRRRPKVTLVRGVMGAA